MSQVQGAAAATQESISSESGGSKYTRNNPFYSTVVENYRLSGADSEKETRHLVFSLAPEMTYAPGDAIGVNPENRAQAVAEVLASLGFTGEERVLDHYKLDICFEEALRTRLTIGKLARGAIGQYAKLPGAAGVGGRGHGDGQAGARIRRSDPRGQARHAPAGGGLQRERRVCDGQGRRGRRLSGRAGDGAGDPHLPAPRRRRHDRHLPRPGRRPLAGAGACGRMIDGMSVEETATAPATSRIEERATLYSSTELKKIRLLYFTGEFAAWEREHAGV